uniref:Ras-GEF domain-containing protein n=1 Tax=Arcella intermedia TaxID=1963864 RepID=A0A6B2L2D1_9EUKA
MLRYWVDNFWSDFSIHKQTLLPEIESFSSAHLPTSDVNLLLHGVKKRIAFNTEKFESVIKQTIFIGDSLAEYSGNLNIWDVESDEIAQQITIIDESLFKAIGLEEFMGQAWTKKDKETRAPNILRFISWFNEISYWIQTELTKEVRLKSRIRKFAKFLDICEFLLAYQNYNSLLAFFSAFLSSSIHRMQKTIAGLPKRHNSFYKKYIQLLDGRDRWAWARGQISSAEGPCLPYLGMYLTDYTMIDDGNKDNTPNGLINYRKRELIASCLQTIVDCQQKPYLHFNVNSEIQEYLLRCKRCRNTDSLFSFSKIAEPKENEPTFEVAVIDKTNEEFIEKYIGKDTFEHLKSEKLSKSKTVKKSVYFKRAKTVDMLRDDIDHDVDVPSDLGQLIQEMEEDYDSQISALQDMIEQMRKQLEVSEATLSKVQREKKRMISRLHKFNEIQRMRQDEDRFDMSENRERSSESQTVSPSPYTSRRNIQLHDSGYLKDSQIVQPDLVQ